MLTLAPLHESDALSLRLEGGCERLVPVDVAARGGRAARGSVHVVECRDRGVRAVEARVESVAAGVRVDHREGALALLRGRVTTIGVTVPRVCVCVGGCPSPQAEGAAQVLEAEAVQVGRR